MNECKNIPKIRFKGFNGVWEQRKLDEVTDVRDGTHDSPKYIEFGHPFITSKNVKNGHINYDEIQYISDEDFNEINKRSKVDKNDILFGMIGTIGNIALIRENPDFAIKNVALIKDIKKIDYLYLYQYLQSNNITKQFDENMDGGTQKFIALNKVRDLYIMYPTISEQVQIGGFLEKIDNLITLHQRKCDKLVELKKSLLEKMFPKNSFSTPEIRFKGFTDVWEQRKLKELGDILTGSTPSTQCEEYYSQDGIFWVTPTDIDSNIIKNTAKKLSKEGIKIARIVPSNTILVTCIASIGKNALVLEKSSFNQQINSLTPYKEFNPYFLLTESTLWSNKMKQQGAAGMMQMVNKNEFSELETFIPNKLEQEKMGTLFEHLDNLITLHQRKLEKLSQIKKSLLDKMFV